MLGLVKRPNIYVTMQIYGRKDILQHPSKENPTRLISWLQLYKQNINTRHIVLKSREQVQIMYNQLVSTKQQTDNEK
jgi:hypothetical protein